MGHGSSRKIIEYDAAVARMGRREAAAVEAGFGRLAAGGTLNRVNWRTGFLGSFTGTPVPEALAAALFDGFDADASGYLTVKEFVCGLAVLRHGTPQEKIRLLFAIYDADRDKRLSDRDLSSFAETLGRGREAPIQHAIDDALKSLASAGSSVGLERFSEWARSHMDSPLVAWIFDMEQRLAQELDENGSLVASQSSPSDTDARSQMVPLDRTVSSALREEAAEMERICEESGVQRAVVDDMHAAWQAAALSSRFEVVDRATFLATLPSANVPGSEPGLPSLAERLFHGLDQTRSGTISSWEWCYGMAVCLQGSAELRREFCFRLFAEVDFSSGRRVVQAAGAHELRYFASLAAAVFSVRSTSLWMPGGSLPDGDEPLLSFDMEPWASAAVALVRALGQLARIDLKLRPDPREEREIVDRLNAKFDPQRPGRVGDTWCLISAKWWHMWCEFSGPDAEDAELQRRRSCGPPSIDNWCLVDPGGSLLIDLYHGIDYELITAGAWRALQAWYGGPGPELSRQVIDLDGQVELEMYLLRVQVSRTNEAGHELLEQRTITCSRTYKLGEVRQMACTIYELVRPTRVFHRTDPAVEWQEADDPNATLHELGFVDGHCFLLQLADMQQFSSNMPPSPKMGMRGHGTVGLQNLGNSCYMNASIQCLLHTPMLGEYFSDMYCYDLNTTGTWGMSGKLAVAFAELVRETRRAQVQGTGFVAPRSFKRVIGDFHTAFAGWRQQDAQEFLSVFLSGLSEDVNRVLAKPYVELKDSDGRPDAEVAAEFWTAHCQREKSVIAALFSGQFKSVIRCTKCGHENASFDPFTFLPVPLPEHDFRWITCTVVSRPRAGVGQHTVQVCARVPKRGQVSDLLYAVAGLVNLDEAELLAADVAEHYLFKLHEVGQLLSNLGEDAQPTIFHAPPPPLPLLREGSASESDASMLSSAPCTPMSCGTGASTDGVVSVCLVHRRLRKVTTYFRNPYKPELFATPVLQRLPANCPVTELHAAAWREVRHLVPDFEIGPDGRWPFSLSRVTRDGTACSRCGWRQACIGCVVPSSAADGGEEPLEIQLSAQDTLGIDWDAQILNQYYKAKIAGHIDVHESVELARIERSAPERLAQCLDCLVKPEELELYCRDCTKKLGEFTETCHAKSLQIWGCPPLLLLQLKRFHSGAGAMLCKLQNLVDFPLRLDLRDYLAGAPSAGTGEVEPMEENEIGEEAPVCLKGWDRPLREREPRPEASPSLKTLSRSTTEYQLYAVVNHIGTMSGGHYTAFVRGYRGRWLCCNDSQVYAISEEEVVTANAYLLFYERIDVAEMQSESLGIEMLNKLGFPSPDPKAMKIDPEQVKRAHWIRSGDGEKGTFAGAGFCGVM